MSTSLSKAEKSYIQAGLSQLPPQRADSRGLLDFRSVALETGVAPLANGSARLNIGQSPHDGSGGTEIIAATKLEVESEAEGGTDGGRIVCTVTCSPAAYPHLSSGALEDLQYDMTTVVHQTLSHPSLHPKNLGIIPRKKSWLLNLDLLVLADAGNVYDAIFMACRAALWDTKVPRTRSVEYKVMKSGLTSELKTVRGEGMDVDGPATSGLDTRKITNATDFELPDYWDEGEILDGRERWPVCVTLNLAPPIHYLDASLAEEAATSLRLLLIFSIPTGSTSNLQAIRLIGTDELDPKLFRELLKSGEKHARGVMTSLNAKLKDEDLRRTLKAKERFEQHR